MLDRIRPGPEPQSAASAAKMSRRKQACPSRSVKALDDQSTHGEGDLADQHSTSANETEDKASDDNCSTEGTNHELHSIPDITPLVMSDASPSLSSALCDIPSFSKEESQLGDHSHPPSPPGLDTPSSSSGIVPLSLISLPASPTSPDHPSTPSSLNSSCSLVESSASKQRRGKKIMPVAGDDGRSHWQCPICNEQMGSDHDFTVHIRSHNTTQAKQPNTCTICGKVLSSQSSLDRHMLVHSGERPFRCKVCQMSFTTNGNMHRHSRIHNKEELKAAAALERGKSARSSARPCTSSSAASATKQTPVSAAPSSSACSSFSGSTKAMSWHHPAAFNAERQTPSVPTPATGIDLQKLINTESFIQPSHIPFQSTVFPSRFVPSQQMGLLSHMVESQRKRSWSAAEDVSFSKRARKETVDATDLRDRLLLPAVIKNEKDSGSSVKNVVSNGHAAPASHTLRKSSKRKQENHSESDIPDHLAHDSLPDYSTHDECKHCHKTFLGRYGLNHHLSQNHKDSTTTSTVLDKDAVHTGADLSEIAMFKCSRCPELFPSHQKLTVHNLLVHLTSQQAEQAVAEVLAAGKNGVSKVLIETVIPGFSDLDFMDFTTDKFTLAAKAWCEQMPRRSSSQFHDFTCSECHCSFPSRSSLVLHKASHEPHSWTMCSKCNSYFLSSDVLYTHMLKHAADRSFVESQAAEEHESAGFPGSMEKKYFLAMFDLVGKDELRGSKRNEEVIEAICKETNNQYYDKLSKSFGSKGAAQNDTSNSCSKLNNDNDSGLTLANESLFSHIPSTPTQENHHLNPSSDVSDIPSMSIPIQASSLASDGVIPSVLFSTFISKPPVISKAEFFGPEFILSGQSVLSSGKFASPLHSSQSPISLDSETAQDQKKGVYSCKFCGASFLNSRALKGHVRVHLGLSPYKCKFCSYSSADKSTLIRHMRTHNGQRPFKCNICDFPFTTKANCERHVRKRHGVIDKEEMEKSVTYEIYPADPAESIDNFQSPDTVCQYCGHDFKFFRALKHHLKTHSSCRQKPFTCSKCLVGFSMKANAIRHVQKQHLDVPNKDIEDFIMVNELLQTDVDYDSDNLGTGYDTGSPSPSSTPGSSGQESAPPMAHSTPVCSSTPRCLPHILGLGERPLDFSLKNSELATRLASMMYTIVPTSASINSAVSEDAITEQPIDLTVKRKPLSSASLSPSTPSTPVQCTTPSKMCKAEVPCSLCNKILSSKEAAHQHLVDVHQVNLSTLNSHAHSDNNNNTSGSQLSAFMPLVTPLQYTSQMSTVMHVHTPATSVPLFQTHPAFSHMQPKLTYLTPRAVHHSLLASMANVTVKKEPGTTGCSSTGSGSESSCDLASVNKIIESTATQNIEIFLKPQVINSGSDESEPHSTPCESADEESDQSLEKLYERSLSGNISIKCEVDADDVTVDDGDDEDNDEIDKDAEQEKGSDSDTNRSDARSNFMIDGEDELTEVKSRSHSKSTVVSDHLMKRFQSMSVPMKKKRNSYADSPHKLRCPHCPRSFPWVSSLNRHMLTHTGQKPFKCPRCPVTFSTKSNRERHLIRKHGVNMLDPASRQTMDRPYKCHLCVFSSFSTESNLLKHYKERHPGCNPPDRYLMKMEGEGETSDSGQQMDKFDEVTLASMDNSNIDGWSENASLDADDLDNSTSSPMKNSGPTGMESIIKREPKFSPLPTTVTSSADPSNNNGLEDNEDDSNDTSLVSALFGGSAERHINPERDNYNVDKITYCWKCSEQFSSRKLLVRHLKEHNIDLPFKCYLCDASYDSRQECLQHQEKYHGSDWIILKEKNGVDSIEVYAERLDRIVERNCKTGQFVEDGEDGESFPVIVGEDGQTEMVASDYLQRKVYCSLCSKRFWSLQDLRRHMRSHTGERPFECDKCQKRFTLKHSMMRHRRKHTTADSADSPTTLSDEEDEIQPLENSATKTPAGNTGSGLRALKQHLAATVRKVSANIPTTVTENGDSMQVMQSSDDDDGDDDGDDILHNLLGVESATIDQIIDAKGSAASLLGV